MKTARLLAYGIGGIVTGLLLENTALRLREKGEKKLRGLKKKAGDTVDKALHPSKA